MVRKREVLLSNLLINEGTCDSFCKYCYYKDEIKLTDQYLYAGCQKVNIDKMINFAVENFNSPMIKICGGEIFLMSNIRELVEELLKHFQYVLIQSNGLHMNEENLKWIIDKKRILIQISLDGHNLDMNEYRFKKPEAMATQLHTIEILKANDVYLELTSVLHNRNTKHYYEFIEYLDSVPSGSNKNALKVTPILIIDKEGHFKPSKEDLSAVEKLIQDYDRFSHILPPKAYLENLNKLLHGESLTYQCFNPIVSLNMIDNGKIKGCTNVLPENVLNVGDLAEDSPETILERFGKTKFQNLLLTTQQWVPLCKNCLNFCSIYNLYLNDTISLEELCENNYMFSLPEIKEQLIKLKNQIALEAI